MTEKKEWTDKMDKLFSENNEEEISINPKKPEPENLSITARQFVRAMGYRWERSAGFLLEQSKKNGRDAKFTVAQWLTFWRAYWLRPVK